MRMTSLMLMLVLMFGCLLHETAQAAGPAESAKDTNERQARAYFAIGLNHFNLGEFAEAIAAFQAGYRSKPLPLFLFNIAQSARKLGKTELAIEYYAQYLEREPTLSAPQRVEARAQLVRLRKQLATEPPPSPTPPAASSPSSLALAAPNAAPPLTQPHVATEPLVTASTARPAYSPERRVFWKRGWFWGTLAGAVVVSAGVGIGTWLALESRQPQRPSLGSITF